tara:strand:+ start:652 stop:1134 length:483 start_codon:yes stop_codon:yes gene_type:complete
MKEYSGIVTREFINKRNDQVANDKRNLKLAEKYFRWDCEFVEKDQAQKHNNLSLTERKNNNHEQYVYDILKNGLIRQDYKFKSRTYGMFVSPKCKKRGENNEFDEFVPWEYAHTAHRWNRGVYVPLKLDEIVYYNVFESLCALHVVTNLNNKGRFTEGFK